MSKRISSMILDMESNIENGTTVKNLVIAKLHENGEITDEIAKKYIEEWQIIVVKDSWYKKLFSGDGWRYRFVKLS